MYCIIPSPAKSQSISTTYGIGKGGRFVDSKVNVKVAVACVETASFPFSKTDNPFESNSESNALAIFTVLLAPLFSITKV